MSTRVTGGYLRGRPLKTLKGQTTRPTTGKVREALFSILMHELQDARVLDLFAGSGSLAIEAVSRGAADAVLIEKSPRAAAVVRQNLQTCDLELRLLVVSYRKGMEILQNESAQFDLIFADPPYDSVPRQTLLDDITRFGLLAPDGLCILEHAGHVPPDDSPACLLTRRFGDTAISIYRL